MKPRSLKLSSALEASLTTYASARGTSASSVVREALEAFLDPAQAGASRGAMSFTARAADLAGSVDGPADLSTNPTYLDAFGQPGRVVRRRRAARTR
jgi:predicted transcriptional regulator